MRISLVALLALSCLPALAAAQPPPEPRGFQPGAGGPRPLRDAPRRDPEDDLNELASALELSVEQRPQFDELAKAYEARLAAATTDGKTARELWEESRDARRNGDAETADALLEQARAVRDARVQARREFVGDVRGILTEPQQAKLDEYIEASRFDRDRGPAGENWFRMLGQLPDQLGMTPEQRASFEALLAERRAQLEEHRTNVRPLLEEMRAARRAGDDARVEELRELIVQNRVGMGGLEKLQADIGALLTDEQRAKLAQLWPAGGPQRRGQPLDPRRIFQAAHRLGLTAEQEDQLRAIERETKKAASEADDPAALAELVKKDVLEILTAEQTAEFEKLLEREGRRARDLRRGPGGPERGGPPQGRQGPPPPPPPGGPRP